MASSTPRLFTPINVGNLTLKHRVALAPLTRYRAAKKEHVPLDIVPTYYSQRSSIPGTFLISEGALIAPEAGGYDNVPGIWSEAQIEGWRKVTDAVHANKSFIFLQLWALGRTGYPDILAEDGYAHVAPSPIPLEGRFQSPRELTIEEIGKFVEWYDQAAENAIKAGFDGVEIHGANGYLIDQFLQSVTNQRTDAYGSTVPNRTRFALSVISSVVSRIGAKRTGIRLSPYGRFQSMLMPDPVPTFSHLISEIARLHPEFAYINLVHPQQETEPPHPLTPPGTVETLDWVRKIWSPRPLIVGGGFNPDLALEESEKYDNEIIAFGKWYISNPDLPKRIQSKVPLTPFDVSTFYLRESPRGYIDYPFADSEQDDASEVISVLTKQDAATTVTVQA